MQEDKWAETFDEMKRRVLKIDHSMANGAIAKAQAMAALESASAARELREVIAHASRQNTFLGVVMCALTAGLIGATALAAVGLGLGESPLALPVAVVAAALVGGMIGFAIGRSGRK